MYAKSKRFNDKPPEIPGPGSYDVKPLPSGTSVHIPRAKRWNDEPSGMSCNRSSFRQFGQMGERLISPFLADTSVDVSVNRSVLNSSVRSNASILSTTTSRPSIRTDPEQVRLKAKVADQKAQLVKLRTEVSRL